MSLRTLQQLLPLDPAAEADPPEVGVLGAASAPAAPAAAALKARFEAYGRELRTHRSQLAPVAASLATFHADLERLLALLVALRERSARLLSNVQAQTALAERLNPFIIDLMVPPEVVRLVVAADVDGAWVENVRFIWEKLQLIEQIEAGAMSDYRGTAAYAALVECVGALRDKALERIRDFLIAQIKLLRAPALQVLSQNIQQRLLEVKEVYAFLAEFHPALARQLRSAYVYTMRWYYETRFAKYLYALQKLRVRDVDQTLLLGAEAADAGTLASVLGGWWGGLALAPAALAPASPPPHRVLMSEYLASIEKRIEVLHDDEPQAIPSQIAETTPFAYWLEFVYKQWSVALVDNIVVEYLFMVEFFYGGEEKFEAAEPAERAEAPERAGRAERAPGNGGTADAAATADTGGAWPHIMFDSVFRMGVDFVRWLVAPPRQPARLVGAAAGTCDGYGVMLIIRMVQDAQTALHGRFHVPIADEYLNELLMVLWPHFTRIVDLNCELIKRLLAHLKRGAAQLAPVAVTQQFAQYLVGLLRLLQGDVHVEPLLTSVRRLRGDFELLLTKVSAAVFPTKRLERELFLYNNYFLVVSILRSERVGGGLFEEQVAHFEALCKAYKK
jgi:hypothetical protein